MRAVRPTVSVVVIANGRPPRLEQWLTAVLPQRPAEVIVADGSPTGWARTIVDAASARLASEAMIVGGHGPVSPAAPARLEHLHRPGAALEVLREAAVGASNGDLVIVTEARMQPSPDWSQRFVDAHTREPHAAVIGGPVAAGAGLDAVAGGIYLCEYAAFAPKVDGASVSRSTGGSPATAVSAANVSYARTALTRVPDPFRWDAMFHHQAAVPTLRLCDAVVTFVGDYSASEAIAMRMHYARAYAARRGLSRMRRLVYTAGAIVLPLVLVTRVARSAAAAPASCRTPAAWTWAVVLSIAWAAGEAVGYAIGAAPQEPLR